MKKKQTILIVDDDEDVRDMFSSLLGDYGYNTETKADAVSAKDWLSSNTPDLILLDVLLPDMNGIELCRWIGSQDNIKDIPIIHLTAVLTDEVAQRDSMLAGAKDFITKPPDFKKLEKKIKALLNKD